MIAISKKGVINLSYEDYKSLSENDKIQFLRKHISDYLMSIGMNSSVSGFAYYNYAISYIFLNWDKNETLYSEGFANFSMMKELYPIIAEHFKKTYSQVERAMRHSVEACFNNVSADVLEKIFGCSISYSKGKLSNKQFICNSIEYLKNYVFVGYFV